MKIHRPLWAEGTFLSSQQFQQQARWEAFSNRIGIAQLRHRHPWGIANVLFDRDALTPGSQTQAVRLRFADGTLIDSDVSDVLPLAGDLRAALKNDSAIVLLALPLAHGNGGNLGQGEQTAKDRCAIVRNGKQGAGYLRQ